MKGLFNMNRDEVIALARKLYADGKGLSYNAIATKFNVDGVPTVSGSGKWEHKMVKRLVSADTLRNAEVKVGLKSEKESKLEYEIDRLKYSVETLENSIVYYKAEKERLESENAGLRSDRDEALKELNTVKQENEELDRKNSFLRERLSETAGHVNGNLKVIADLTAYNDRLKESNELLQKRYDGLVNEAGSSWSKLSDANDHLKEEVTKYRNMSAGLGADNNRLNRLLNEAELRFNNFYESEITRLGSELAKANQRIQELHDKQTFLKPESESAVPKNFMGWTVGKRSDGRGYNIYRKIAGKLHGLYIGKEWNADDARNKIAAFESKQKPQSELFAGSECKSCQHQVPFESRLRAVCPETVRTYRLDTVAKSFHDYDFSREMIALAEQKRIELLAGDPSQCDVSKLVQYRGRMYVNFEWR